MERANKRARVSSDTNGSSMRKKPHLPPEVLASIFNQMEETPLSLSLVNKEWRSLYLKKRVFSLHVLPPKRTDTPATFSNKKKRSGPPAILLNGAQRQFRRKRKALLIEQQSLTPAERRKNQAEAVDMIYKLIKENCFSVHTLDFEFSEIADDHLNKIFKIYLKREELVEGLRPVDGEEEEEEEDQSAEALAKREKRRLEIAKDFVGLRWVSLRGCSNITNHALRNMPSTVMYLDISFKRIKGSHLKGPLIDREGFRYLPSKLHTLNVQYSYYVDKRDFQFLPQRLHTLIWTHEGENIPPSHTVTFPKDMTTLQMPISTFADISCLPPKLKKLRPTRIGPNVHEQAFLFCPSTLKKLDFSSCPNDMDGKVLPFLPTALRSLSLADCWKLADVHFFNLPVSLVALDLSRSGATNRTVENIKLSSLTALQKLSLAETEVDDNGIRFINATALRSLDLSLNNVTDAGLPFLPSTLRKLDLSCTDVTSKGLTSYLPRGVTILNVYGCPNLTGDAFYHLPQMKVVNGKAVDVVPKSEE